MSDVTLTIDLNVSSHNWVEVGPDGLYVCSVCSYRRRRASNGVDWNFWKNLTGSLIRMDEECADCMKEVVRSVLNE